MRTLLGLFDIEDIGDLTDDCAIVGDGTLCAGLVAALRPPDGAAMVSRNCAPVSVAAVLGFTTGDVCGEFGRVDFPYA